MRMAFLGSYSAIRDHLLGCNIFPQAFPNFRPLLGPFVEAFSDCGKFIWSENGSKNGQERSKNCTRLKQKYYNLANYMYRVLPNTSPETPSSCFAGHNVAHKVFACPILLHTNPPQICTLDGDDSNIRTWFRVLSYEGTMYQGSW
jgi:hypothetical protein